LTSFPWQVKKHWPLFGPVDRYVSRRLIASGLTTLVSKFIRCELVSVVP
jgi:hypothetical protein